VIITDSGCSFIFSFYSIEVNNPKAIVITKNRSDLSIAASGYLKISINLTTIAKERQRPMSI